jgi:adenylate kinase family enzyme
LLSQLKNIEYEKIKKINPSRYILSTSISLNPAEKGKIKTIFSPYIICTSDILGRDDINALINRHPNVEKIYFKLWISSSNILLQFLNSGIYNFSEQIIVGAFEKNQNYVVTSAHISARNILKNHDIIIITGEPGVGKTTLAEQLCLEYLCDKFEFISISENIKEAFSVIDKAKKQIFYFDDFLGRNFLSAIRSNQDSSIVQFMNCVANSKNKKFILTSRTNILDKGYYLSQIFKSSNIQKNEYIINIDNYTYTDKAKILYSFIWKSDISKKLCEEIISKKEYRKIVYHKNYNPRILELICNSDILEREAIGANNYIEYIRKSLANPAGAWQHPYNIQLDGLSRALIDITVLNNNKIHEEKFQELFFRLQHETTLHGDGSLADHFFSVIKPLCRSFIKRSIDDNEKIVYSPFNPAISDFVINEYLTSPFAYLEKLFIIDTVDSIIFLQSAKLHNAEATKKIANMLLSQLVKRENFLTKPLQYILVLCNIVSNNLLIELFKINYKIIKSKILHEHVFNFNYLLPFVEKFFSYIDIEDDEKLEIIIHIISHIISFDELDDTSTFLKNYGFDEYDNILKEFKESLIKIFEKGYLGDLIENNIGYVTTEDGYYDEDGIISPIYIIDEDELSEVISKTTDDLIVNISQYDIKNMFYKFDLEEIATEQCKIFSYEDEHDEMQMLDVDIDDLFSAIIDEKYN